MNKPKLLKVYYCTECAELEVKTATPKIRGCKMSSFHKWIILGERGPDKYLCDNCGIKVNTNDIPTEIGCRKGTSHKWTKI
ncbi:MAG TPA: hypothetical protein VK806_13770 [Bacteroidia bacterium]|jgi:hypothetical protein|nr:hypothetical protein [Bacteroidia bacterium]